MFVILSINPFHATGRFLYPLKYQKFSRFLMFSGVRKKTNGIKCVEVKLKHFTPNLKKKGKK